ncbi:universal stress protein [Desulfococcaceae bacterium HSG7]|nr:universal stress protein [Desulfococcaceae bacterium HSG9]MDM8555547.1 universal stress protein [Desulfococcaceae bacterium HSG7]
MKIMVGYNGPQEAWDALKLAQKNAKAFDGHVYIVTSLKDVDADDKEKIEEAEENLEYAQNILKENEISCETHLLIRGMSPGEDLIKFVKDNKIDQVVIGVRKKSKVEKLVFGSTAQYVILNAPCPVITIK